MKKIAFIGAGSFEFTRTLVRDLLSFPALSDCEIALMDIDPVRLSMIKQAVDKIVQAGNYPARVSATLDRVEALKGADGVLITVLSGGVEVWRHDVEIPAKYGIDINVGDTRGPSGIFRALRTIPLMLDILRDAEEHCPDATILNYTNPMAMLCRAMQDKSSMRITGLCHSVQGTAEMLAGWIGADFGDVSYLCAGINHQAFYLKYEVKGKDAYPLLREAVRKPEVYAQEIVRNEMFRHLDYYVTESSGHNSEYNAWFRKRPDLIEKYCVHGTGWNPGVHGYILDEYLKREKTWKGEMEKWVAGAEVELGRGKEYAAYIFNAIFGDQTMFEFNGNVRNFGLVDNLPEGACVEVPVLASKRGLDPLRAGALPEHLAILVNTSSRCEELAVRACLEGDPRMVYHAICMDPLTSAVLSLDEIKAMTDEMMERNEEWLPQFKGRR